MITNFKVCKDEKRISWKSNGQLLEFNFKYPVAANHNEYLDQVLVQSDALESGEKNLTIYNPDGSIAARPEMPKLKHRVDGVYAVWFGQGKKEVTVILLTDEYAPYDTACTFNLEKYTFSKFHPTK